MTDTFEIAPRWRRLLALCYELFLVAAVVVGSAIVFQLLLPALSGGIVEFIYELALTYGYFAWCWHRSGQTLSMQTWRLKLIHPSGALGWRVMTVRYLVVLTTFLPLLPAVVAAKHLTGMHWIIWVALAWAAAPFAWSVFDRDRQFLQDRIAGTRIILLPPSR
ncbi:MAG: RDD family protein [Burkholderiales bacterium]|nr:RDD family protein [Burkholderiales bacterium]